MTKTMSHIQQPTINMHSKTVNKNHPKLAEVIPYPQKDLKLDFFHWFFRWHQDLLQKTQWCDHSNDVAAAE